MVIVIFFAAAIAASTTACCAASVFNFFAMGDPWEGCASLECPLRWGGELVGKRGSETASVLPLRRFHDPKVGVTTRAGRGRVATSCQVGTAVVPTPATNSARQLLRHQSGKTGYFPVETRKPSCPTQGATPLSQEVAVRGRRLPNLLPLGVSRGATPGRVSTGHFLRRFAAGSSTPLPLKCPSKQVPLNSVARARQSAARLDGEAAFSPWLDRTPALWSFW
jgi:hypothetical protein